MTYVELRHISISSLEVTLVIVFICFGMIRSSSVAAQNGQYSFVANASNAQAELAYDYIVVGGGTAGCPLAATLSQSYRVLLLEKGGAPFDHPDVQNKLNFAQVLLSATDESNFPPTQAFQSEEGVFNYRARILGGGTSVNAGLYSRAEPIWISEGGLDPARVNESYEWVESVVASFPTLGPWQTAVRDALLEVGVTPYLGMTYDHLDGTKVSGTIFDSTGHRRTAADLLHHANPENIQVLLYATAHQILFSLDGSNGSAVPKATGVIFSDELGNLHQAVTSAKTMSEVILASGAIGSPHLLMLSGIGPAEQLQELGIPVVLNQPAVGQKMADNPTVTMLVPAKEPIEDSLISTAGILSTQFYIETSSGAPSSIEMTTLNGFPPDYRNRKIVENITSQLKNFPLQAFSAFTQAGVLQGKLARPVSRGTLKINSTDIRNNPLVRFNYFADTRDLYACAEGVRVMQQLLFKSKAMENITYSELPDAAKTWAGYVGPLAPETSEVGLLSQWCRDTVTTSGDFHGGCEEGVVVGSDYKVLGVDGLRVVDSSTFKFSPGTNPQATVMMLGRYAGLSILKENGF